MIWQRNRRGDIARRALAWVVLLGVSLATVPFPVGSVAIAPGEGPFPCQDHGCGCATAERCWTNCCCLSPKQRLEWAAKRGIRPPEYARIAARDTQPPPPVTPSTASVPAPPPSCARTCCAAKTGAPQRASEHSEAECRPVSPLKDASPEDASPVTRLVISLQALGCQGQASDFTLLPWATVHLPPPPRIHEPLQVDSLVSFPPALVSVRWAPDSPPPEAPSSLS